MLSEEDDYRMEAVVAFWLENGLCSFENITIAPKGTFERRYKKDILEVEKQSNPPDSIQINISREGLYDMLPEGMFHEAIRKAQKNIKDSVEESHRYKREEKAARKLFLPLEQEFYRQKVWLEMAELQTSLSSVRSDSVSMFFEFWGLKQELFTSEQKNFMLAVLPNLHRIVGNMDLTAYCLGVILQEEVEITSTFLYDEKHVDPLLYSPLGEVLLGVNSVLGKGFVEDDPVIQVKIGPVDPENLFPWLPGERLDKLVNLLCGYFFPAENEVVITLKVSEGEEEFGLEKEVYSPRLGFTTVL